MARTSSATGSSRKKTTTATKSEQTMLRELFLDELKDIYWAEKHLVKSLPKMKRAATNEDLVAAFDEHLAVTENQVARLEQAFESLGVAARAKKCEAMDGLVKEAQNLIEELPKGSAVLDAGLIIAAQKVEHYEIAAYGSLVQLAKTMGEDEVAEILAETLAEEKETDEKLTELAVSSINIEAEEETEDEE